MEKIKTFEEILNSGNININEFENYRLEQIETVKLKTKKASKIIIFVCILMCFISIFILGFIGIPIIIFISVMLIFTLRNVYRGKFVEKVQVGIINKMLKSLDKSFEYKPNEFIPETIFKESNFAFNFNHYIGEDYFHGNFHDIPLQISQLSVSRFRNNNKGSICFLDGILLISEFKQPFSGRTTILPDSLQKKFSSFFGQRNYTSSTIKNDIELKFQNIEFDKNFRVFTNNAVETKKIISGNLINYLLELNTNSMEGIYFSFSGKNIYLGLNNRCNIFQIDINNEINKEILKKYYSEILLLLNYILNINSFIEENIA